MKQEDFKIFRKKKVIVTGHTGFKGSWLTLWLVSLGAKVVGISKPSKEKNNHFDSLKLKKKVKTYYVDIRNLKKIKKIFKIHEPDFLFHLAGQSIVKKSYEDPVDTVLTNSIGTLNILECLKTLKNQCYSVLITSDKVYKNFEIKRGYRESDILGGKDPYSASKASAEIIIQSYFSSFLSMRKKNIRIAIARAGNVIGGGDWNPNRLLPDCIKSWSKGKSAILRNPKSTRPWQNVLDVVRGYMILALSLRKNSKINGHSFNFGPNNRENYSVIQVVKYLRKYWPNVKWKIKKTSGGFFESKLLKLNSKKSSKLLGWKCYLNMKESLKMTIDWYKNFFKYKNKYLLSMETLNKYKILINKKSKIKR